MVTVVVRQQNISAVKDEADMTSSSGLYRAVNKH